MPRDDERPCWVWWDGDWHEGFVLSWQQDWQDQWRAYAEWTVVDGHGPGFPAGHRATLPANLVLERITTDPRGRGGHKPPPLDTSHQKAPPTNTADGA